MRCRVGDMAVIVRAGHPMWEPSVGRIVRLRALCMCGFADGPSWAFEGHVVDASGLAASCIPDANLRPIRPTDGEDEMLRIAGLPREIAHA